MGGIVTWYGVPRVAVEYGVTVEFCSSYERHDSHGPMYIFGSILREISKGEEETGS